MKTIRFTKKRLRELQNLISENNSEAINNFNNYKLCSKKNKESKTFKMLLAYINQYFTIHSLDFQNAMMNKGNITKKEFNGRKLFFNQVAKFYKENK